MKTLSALLTVISAMSSLSSAFAYDIPNHFDLSRAAVNQSVLGRDASVISNLGLSNLNQELVSTDGENSSDFTDGCLHKKRLSIILLVGCGAQFEDVPGTRSFNHFFDPANSDRPLNTTRHAAGRSFSIASHINCVMAANLS